MCSLRPDNATFAVTGTFSTYLSPSSRIHILLGCVTLVISVVHVPGRRVSVELQYLPGGYFAGLALPVDLWMESQVDVVVWVRPEIAVTIFLPFRTILWLSLVEHTDVTVTMPEETPCDKQKERAPR